MTAYSTVFPNDPWTVPVDELCTTGRIGKQALYCLLGIRRTVQRLLELSMLDCLVEKASGPNSEEEAQTT
jgi:hypothetical protein